MNKLFLLGIVFLIVLSSFVSGALTDNIRYYYSCDDDDVTGTTLIDSSGTANATMDAGIGTYAGILGEARDVADGEKFDITDLSYADGSAWTFNAWVYIDTFSGNHAAFCGTVSNTDYTSRLTTRWDIYPGGGTYLANSLTTLTAESWQMITFQRHANNTLMGFRNGSLDMVPFDNSGTYDFQLCGKHYNNAIKFDGRYDEFGFWDRALTPAELTTLYNSGAGYNPYTILPMPIISDICSTSPDPDDCTEPYNIGTDLTPSFNFTTDLTATCYIGDDNSTWTVCSTTGSAGEHICTEPATHPLVWGADKVYLNCSGDNGNTYDELDVISTYLSGNVTDSSDRLISGALVTASKNNTATVYSSNITDTNGYWIIGADIGFYTICAYDPDNITLRGDCTPFVEAT